MSSSLELCLMDHPLAQFWLIFFQFFGGFVEICRANMM